MEFSFEVEGKKVVLRRILNSGRREVLGKQMKEIFRVHYLVSTKLFSGQQTYYQDEEIQAVLDKHSLVFTDI